MARKRWGGHASGAGQPNTFGCAKCRQEWNRNHTRGESYLNKGTLGRITLTGRVRPVHARKGGGRVCFTRYEYRCEDCGHVGWSRHIEVARKADLARIAPHESDPRGIQRFEKEQGTKR